MIYTQITQAEPKAILAIEYKKSSEVKEELPPSLPRPELVPEPEPEPLKVEVPVPEPTPDLLVIILLLDLSNTKFFRLTHFNILSFQLTTFVSVGSE